MLTQELLELRKTGIGGSDAAAIAGLSKYKTPLEVYFEKLGLSDSNNDNPATYFGSLMEPIIVNEYIKKTGLEVAITKNTLKSEKYPWMLANIDGFVPSKRAILECKYSSPYRYRDWGEEDSEEIPDEYLLQCAHYAIVCDVKEVDLMLLMPPDFKLFNYQRNKALEKNLIELEHDFWHNNVLKQVPPEPKNYADTLMLWPDATDSKAIATDEIESAIAKYKSIQANIKNYNLELMDIKSRVCSFMKHKSYLVDNLGNALGTWKEQTTKRLDIELLKSDKIYNQYLKESKTRVFRLKGDK